MSKEEAKDKLIEVLMTQVVDLSMMSKIELGDDVIAEIKRLREIINKPYEENLCQMSKEYDDLIVLLEKLKDPEFLEQYKKGWDFSHYKSMVFDCNKKGWVEEKQKQR